MYLGDPRESLVDLNAPGVWEADNRVEERWQWGAQITDLCGLSPEDYKNSTAVTVKTIQNCGECGGGGSQAENNKGTANLNDNGEFTVSFESPVASTLYIFVTFIDDSGDEYSFTVKVDKDSDSASYDVSSLSTEPPFEITSIELGFKEDGSDAGETIEDNKYKYSVSTGGGGEEDGKVFAFSILCTKTDTLTGDDYQEIIDAQGQGFDEFLASYDETDFGGVDTAQAMYVVPCTTVPQWMPADVEEQFFRENSYDFVFLTRKPIMEIKEDFTADIDNWEKSNVTMDGKVYNLWLRRDLSGAQCPYEIGTEPCDGYDITYTLKINK